MADSAALTFIGATGTVTGSHHLLEMGGARLLLDCGLYQGERAWRERNWQPFPVPPDSIDAVLLSHAHIDHTGYLPRLLRDGHNPPVYASAATRELCGLLLPDSARLNEEEAEYRNRKGATTHQPALPLYTEDEAERAATSIRPLPFEQPSPVFGGATVTLRHAGHILGSSMLQIEGGGVRLVFTGDLGRRSPLMLRPPEQVERADYLILESTYGDRLHGDEDPAVSIEQAIKLVIDSRGALVVPAFAVGRTQEILYLIRRLEIEGRVPSLPVIVDSPMATDVTAITMHHPEELAPALREMGPSALRPHDLRFTRSVEESKALNGRDGPMVIISASGMATGGRILHHLVHRLPDPRTVVLLVGYQGEGTRGRRIQEGADSVRIFHQDVPARARVQTVQALSAHADAGEILAWLGGFTSAPRRTFLVHGDDAARTALAGRIRSELGWDVVVPVFGQRVALD
jgi:metallo-beta-lactamase family protein